MRSRVLLLTVFAACRFDETTAPGLVIRCASTDECPTGQRCQVDAGACWPAQADGTPAVLTTFDVPLRLAKQGTGLSVTLTASESLIVPPELSFEPDAGGTFAMFAAVPGPTPPSYAFSYVAQGTEPEADVSLFVELIDSSGTVAAPAALGSITFDFTPPGIVSEALRYSDFDSIGPTSTATLDVVLSEATAMPPTVSDPSGLLTVSWSGADGLKQHFLARAASANPVAQSVMLTLSAIDLAGNVSALHLATPLSLDTLAPAKPDALTAGRIVYRRFPHGSATRPPRTFEVQGEAGAVDGVGTVIVTAPSLGNLELGRGASNSDGSFGPVVLAQLDVVNISLTFVDHAGNASQPQPVLDVEWTASVRAPTSPHHLYTETVSTDRWTQPLATAVADPSSLGTLDDAGIAVSSGVAWRAHTSSIGSEPQPGRTLLTAPAFGGLVGIGGIQPYVLNRSSDIERSAWEPLALADPELDGDPVSSLALSYDLHLRSIVIASTTGTWLYGGAGWKLIDPTPVTGAAALTFDPDRGATVLASSAGLQRFDGRHWVSVTGTLPGLPQALGYDWTRQNLVLLQTDGGAASLAKDATVWTPLPGIADGGDVGGTHLAWDPGALRLIARNGCGGSINHQWDGQWTGLGPPANFCDGIAWEPRRGAIVQVKGVALATLADDNTWHVPTGTAALQAPSAKGAHQIFPMDGKLVVQGGNNGVPLNSFNVFDGVRWSSGSMPVLGQRSGGGAAEGPQGVIIAGGVAAPAFSVAQRTAFNADDAGFVAMAPTVITRAGVVYEPNRDSYFLYQPTTAQWLNFDGGGAAFSGASPAFAAYDRRGYLVGVFADGGTQTMKATDVDWAPAAAAPADPLLGLVREPIAGQVLAVSQLGEVYRFDGNAWAHAPLSDPDSTGAPSPRQQSPLASSTALGASYLFGGVGPNSTLLGDTWELRASGVTPAVMLDVDLTAAGFPPSTTFETVRINGAAGGSGASDGVRLQTWSLTGWGSGGSNNAPASSPAAILSGVSGIQAHRLLINAPHLGVRFVCAAGSSGVPAQLFVDWVEVTIQAHLAP